MPLSLCSMKGNFSVKLVENRVEIQDYVGGSPGYNAVDCRTMPFFIRRDGSWLHNGQPINRKSMVCLFSSLITRDENGRYMLQSPAERGYIEVEDVPFVVVALQWHGVGRTQELSFLTNTDECVVAGPAHGLRMVQGRPGAALAPYLHVRNGQGEFAVEARINRPTYYELVALAEPGLVNGNEVMGVWSGGVFFPIGDLPVG